MNRAGPARGPGTREDRLVELVDPAGTPVGRATVREAHDRPGRLHRAFSVLLLDERGRVLLQRRAAGKTRFPLHWANACCGHPDPGEPPVPAAARRLREELGVTGVELTEVGVYAYRAEDPGTGRVEHEYDHVLTGAYRTGTPVAPDPAEVAEVAWATPADLRAALAAGGDGYAPWLAGVLALLPGWGPAGAR